MHTRKLSGFTLIELLVVIAIIAILAAILFPVFAQAREKARTVSCLSNAKQLGTAIVMYLQDYDETFPGYVQDSFIAQGNATPIWSTLVQPYVKNQQIVVCNSASNSKWGGLWGERGWLSIGYNNHFGGWVRNGPNGQEPIRVTIPGMDKPAKNVVFADSSPGDNNRVAANDPRGLSYRGYLTNGWDPRFGACGRTIVINGGGDTLSDRHNLGTNVTFADGHAKWYRTTTLTPNGASPDPNDWCHCVVDKNAAGVKWFVPFSCSTD